MQHCDALSGPVVKAAKKALTTGNINYVLIWVPEDSEVELKEALERTLSARKSGNDAKKLADNWFFETAVRLHRAGEGEGFNGLRPEGPTDPIVQEAEEAIEDEDASKFISMLGNKVENVLEERYKHVLHSKNYDVNDVKAGRKFIEAYIKFVVFAHHLYEGLSSESTLDKKSKHEH